MVKIRLRRIGAKNRPFYRVVVAKSTAGRNGAFIETIGTYDPIVKPTHVAIDDARALHWLMEGAQPTETAARLLNKTGVLETFFSQRPSARKNYGFLDKRTAASSVRSVMDKPAEAKAEPKAEAAPAPTPEPVAEAPAAPAEEPAETPVAEAVESPAEPAEPAAEAAETAEEAPAAQAEAAPAEDAQATEEKTEPAPEA